MIRFIPNALTILRIVLTIVAVFLVPFYFEHLYVYLFFIFVVAAVSDFIDGYVARKFNVVSDFGKVFDPLADKVLAFVFLIILYGSGIIPPVVILLLIVRDLVVDNVRAFFAKSIVIPAIFTAKAKTTMMFVLIGLALYTLAFRGSTLLQELTFWAALVALALSYISAAQYARIFYREYKNLKKEDTMSSSV